MQLESILLGSVVTLLIVQALWVRKKLRQVAALKIGFLKRIDAMATKEDLAKAVNDLKAADAVNKSTIAGLRADNAAKDTQIQSLQSQLTDAQAAAAAADKVDDSIVSDIESVATDLNPAASGADPNAPVGLTGSN